MGDRVSLTHASCIFNQKLVFRVRGCRCGIGDGLDDGEDSGTCAAIASEKGMHGAVESDAMARLVFVSEMHVSLAVSQGSTKAGIVWGTRSMMIVACETL